MSILGLSPKEVAWEMAKYLADKAIRGARHWVMLSCIGRLQFSHAPAIPAFRWTMGLVVWFSMGLFW